MEFKRSILITIRGMIVCVIGAIAVAFILYMFTENFRLSIIVFVMLAVILVLSEINANKQRIVLEDGVLKIFNGAKLKNEFVVAECGFSARTKSGGTTTGTDCKLIVKTAAGDEYIDCSKIGVKQFHELMEKLGFWDEDNIVAIQPKKK